MKEPIGIFDSGVGGLSVVSAIRAQHPHESIIYFGDTARLPYGDKSPEKIIQYSLENAQFLLDQKVKAIIVACNTASVHAHDALISFSPVPVLDVLISTVEEAIQLTKGKIGVIGTNQTIRSNRYEQELLKRVPTLSVTSVPTPLLVPLVESQFFNHTATRLILEEYLRPLKRACVDTLILGCTHYPFLKPIIQEVMGGEVALLESGAAVSGRLSDLFPLNHGGKGSFKLFVSDDPENFSKLAAKYFAGDCKAELR